MPMGLQRRAFTMRLPSHAGIPAPFAQAGCWSIKLPKVADERIRIHHGAVFDHPRPRRDATPFRLRAPAAGRSLAATGLVDIRADRDVAAHRFPGVVGFLHLARIAAMDFLLVRGLHDPADAAVPDGLPGSAERPAPRRTRTRPGIHRPPQTFLRLPGAGAAGQLLPATNAERPPARSRPGYRLSTAAPGARLSRIPVAANARAGSRGYARAADHGRLCEFAVRAIALNWGGSRDAATGRISRASPQSGRSRPRRRAATRPRRSSNAPDTVRGNTSSSLR